MIPSRELLQRYSDETGYAISPLEKVTRLGEFAANVGLRSKVCHAGPQRGSLRGGCRTRGARPRTPLPVRASRGCKAGSTSRVALEDRQR